MKKHSNDDTQNPTNIPVPELVLTRDGKFVFDGKVVENKRVQKFFHSILRKTEDGSFEIDTGWQKGRVIVEDTPTFALRILGITDDCKIKILSACGREFTIDPATIRYREEHGDFVAVRIEDGLAVRLLRNAHNDLSAMLEEDENGDPFFEICNKRYYPATPNK